MKGSEIILATPEQLRDSVKKAMAEYDKEKESKKPRKLYTVNELSKILGKSYNTVRKYIDQGYLKTTANGLITENSIDEFLGNQ